MPDPDTTPVEETAISHQPHTPPVPAATPGTPSRPVAWPVYWDYALVAVLMLLQILALLNGSTMADLNRDLNAALAIVDGGEWVTAGPAIAHRMHNGPVWFYLLALPLWISRSWAVVTVWGALLVALVWPLAYALGRVLGGRLLGLALLTVVALPNWFAVYDLVYSHPALIPTTTLATLLATIAWWRRPSTGRLILAAFIASLGMHAHVSSIGVTVFLLVLVLWHWWHGGFRLGALLGFLLGSFILWLPYFLAQWLSGGNELAQAAGYAGDFRPWRNLLDWPATLYGHGVKGPWFALRYVAEWPVAMSLALAAGTAAVVAMGLAGLRWSRIPWPRAVVLGLLPAVIVATMLLRNFTPFYQTLSLQMVLAALIAVGWTHWLGRKPWLLAPLLLLALMVQLGEWRGTVAKVQRGVAVAPWSVLGDLGAPGWSSAAPRWWLASSQRDAAARQICDNPAPTTLLLGHLGHAVAADGGISVRLHCPRRVPLLRYQSQDTHALVVAGISRAAAAALGVSGFTSYDGFALLNTVRYAPAADAGVPLAQHYPPRLPPPAEQGMARPFPLRGDEILAVVNPVPELRGMAPPVVERGDLHLQPVYQDGQSFFYRCTDCREDQPLTVFLSPSAAPWVQLFAIAADGSTQRRTIQ